MCRGIDRLSFLTDPVAVFDITVMTLSDNSLDQSKTLHYSDLVSLPDETLLAQLLAGHHDALAVLFDRYHRLVLNIALRILRDAGEAEDLMQAVFLDIFKAAAQFDPAKGTTKVWILQYAYHRSFNRRRYLNLRGIYERPADSAAEPRTPGPAQTRSLGVLESARLVQQALAGLNKVQKKTLELAFYEGLTMREIASGSGESLDSVRHHYYRGLEKLRGLLCGEPDGRQKSSSVGEGVPNA
jgi:RNA polymerase sigma-70 factor (ECF subfamily)